MPEYLYLCPSGHVKSLTHRMMYTTGVICDCGAAMVRKPQTFLVSWGGLKPSDGDLSPVARDMIENRSRRRDEYEENYG
jgi:hypothetical protein